MSLKAKIEAVIYASEEPVTLAQLTGLLGHEAQAELDHLDSAQHSLALDETGGAASGGDQPEPPAGQDEDALNSEVLADEASQSLSHDGDDAGDGQNEPDELTPEAEPPADVETEAQHAEALDRHMHAAAAEEAAPLRAERQHAAADAAAM